MRRLRHPSSAVHPRRATHECLPRDRLRARRSLGLDLGRGDAAVTAAAAAAATLPLLGLGFRFRVRRCRLSPAGICGLRGQGGRLCRWDEVCPGGSTPGQAYSTSQASDVLADWIGGAKFTDEWMAIEPVMSNSMNTEWIQIGARNFGTALCMFTSHLGYPNFNSWGCQTFTGYIACC